MMCIAVSAVCICIFMFFYDSSAYWTKRPFRTVRHWQASPFTFTILLACIVRWAHQPAEMWFPLKPTYDFNLIQQPQKKKTEWEPKRPLLSILFPLISSFFCFCKALPLFLVSFLFSSFPHYSSFLPSSLCNSSCPTERSQTKEMTLPVWAKPDYLLLSMWPGVNLQSNQFLKDIWHNALLNKYSQLG